MKWRWIDGTLPPILFGSHIDSVPNGGNFDGDLGSLAAFGVLEALEATGLRTRHPRYDVTVTGFANHAGTTAMADRQDALLAASHLTIAVRDVVNSEPGRQVGTVGRLEVTPNAPNVIPGVVRLTIELRDLSAEKLKRLAELIRLRATEIEKQTKTSIDVTLINSTRPANAAVEVQQAIERVAGRLGLGSRRLPSGAGHDAQMMAQLHDGHGLCAEYRWRQPLAA